MNVILFDENPSDLYPLSYTRPISCFRVGILTIKEKWELFYKNVSILTQDYLSSKFNLVISKDNLWINSKIIPSPDLIVELKNLRDGELLEKDKKLIAFRNGSFDKSKLNHIESNASIICINNLWDIFLLNDIEIRKDFKSLTYSRNSIALDDKNTIIGNQVFIEEGAHVSCSILNSEEGPIYIGKGAKVMEGSIIRGPFSMLEGSVLKMGAKIYGATSLGPFCKVGGEVNNSVIFGYSSKAHDGFLGNSVIGEWCNLGADTNTSNLKNNYDTVKVWDYNVEKFINSEQQFCGLIMGDHSKSSINTMFNTGTVVGVSVNVFGSGFPRNFIPSFSWGGSSGYSEYSLTKVYEVVKRVFDRRNVIFSLLDQDILLSVFNMTKKYRKL